MSRNYTAFAYKNGNSLIHRMPAWIKILLLPVMGILYFNLPFYFSLCIFAVQLILCIVLKFSFRQIVEDFKPIAYYAVLLYLSSFLIYFFTGLNSVQDEIIDGTNAALEEGSRFVAAANYGFGKSFKDAGTAILLLRLFTVMQSASILFKTSSSLQIREGVGAIEGAIRKILPVSKKNKFTNTISLFVCFIPMVYRNWEQCKRAWFARGGKKGITMYMRIFPSFFSSGIKQAYNASRAIMSRD